MRVEDLLLTDEELAKVRESALKLAEEFENGQGPVLNQSSWCGCGIGHVVRGAGMHPLRQIGRYPYDSLASGLDQLVDGAVSDATDRAVVGETSGLPSALRALAEKLVSETTQSK